MDTFNYISIGNFQIMKRSLDLHGFHIHTAWKKVDIFLQECYHDNYKSCEIICGQGLIRNEIETWLYLNRYVRDYKFNTRTQGSYNIKLKKRNTK
jgi:DNA-nicking Smr family endonuclease